MSEFEDESLVQETDRNAALLMCVAILAYQLEFGEPVSVDANIVNDIIKSSQHTNKSVPKIEFLGSGEGRMTIKVSMHEPEEFDLSDVE